MMDEGIHDGYDTLTSLPGGMPGRLDILELMERAYDRGASDIHLAPNRYPVLRIDGTMCLQTDLTKLDENSCETLLYSILKDTQRLELDRNWELDFSYELDLTHRHASADSALSPDTQRRIVRFRINMHRQRQGLAAVFRLIKGDIPTVDFLGLEETIVELTKLPRGFVLVTGPTGCGKSSTLACMIDMINHRDSKHILTIEDPIEYVYEEDKCTITQRELHEHTQSFKVALKSALREDPDVILIGEMRELETIQLALTAAETGHLVFATLHTTDASQSVDRIIDVFEAAQQPMVRSQLASVLQAIVCQVLLPRAEGSGRIAAREILRATPAVRTLIREQQTQKIYNSMVTGIKWPREDKESETRRAPAKDDHKGPYMCPLEYSLAEKVCAGLITDQVAAEVCNRPSALKDYLASMARDVSAAGKRAGSEPTPGVSPRTGGWGRSR